MSKEYSFEEAVALLKAEKCCAIGHKGWDKGSKYNCIYYNKELDVLEWCDKQVYDLSQFIDWKYYGWVLIYNTIKEEENMKPARKDKTSVISQYIYKNRRGNKAKVGLLVAFNEGLNVKFGYSLCSKEDRFDKEKAASIAVGRANKGTYDYPPSIKKDVEAFKGRVVRYFKDCSHNIA